LEKLNQKKPPMDPKTKLFQYYYDKLDMKIFSSEVVGRGSLPPHRSGINHAIELEKDEFRREKNVPWGLLYSITKKELLMLRKTLTNHFDKRWICVSKSSAEAFVFFVKKPGGGL
jgi:hypothetical protein